jgi:acetoin utilization deacetylase AcuC-like enzyme
VATLLSVEIPAPTAVAMGHPREYAVVMAVGWVYDRFFLRHKTDAAHPERPERLEVIVEELSRAGLLARMRPLTFGSASVEVLGWVHEPAYIDLVRMACEQGFSFIGTDETLIGPESYDAAVLAVGGVLAACDAVMAGTIRSAFCAVRPPGHHAERDRAMGYCLFNNVAVAAEYVIRRHGLKRVAILDWDVHHGNGTQHIFEERGDVLYISPHEGPQFLYPGTGYEMETGTGPGLGYTLNLPMRPGSGDREYRQAFTKKVIPKLEAFGPEFLLISAGFDAIAGDRISDINLEPGSFGWMTRDVAGIARKHCDGRLVSVLEGGYDLNSLGRCVAEHVQVLLDESGTA